MKKLQILILVVAGILSFASAFSVSWVMKKKKAESLTAQLAAQQAEQDAAAINNATASKQQQSSVINFASLSDNTQLGMTERQLQHLIHDVRDKLQQNTKRQRQLDTETERIEISRAALQEDIDRLNELRDKLNVTLANIQQKETELKQSILEIETLERNNLQRLAGTYDKMDSTQAGKIMISMAASNQLQDSVKILYYMNERMAGKILSEIATTQPELASLISMHLKRVKEGT
ncbi:MAG: MotE family protein [Planctomycetota bacterium]|jgi:chromosome segregation ATPase